MAHRKPAQAPRCVAPLDDDAETLCGRPAVTTRIVEGIEMPLCREHAAEFDVEREESQSN